MKKTVLLGLVFVGALPITFAGNPTGKPTRVHLRQSFYHPATAQLKAAKAEASSAGMPVRPFRPSSQNRGGNPPSTLATTLAYLDLGQSVNPFTSVGGGRNYVSVVPELNTVAFFRRGGPSDPGGTTNKPGDKLYYDLNTKGGVDGKWQISRGQLFNNELYPVTSTVNYGPRYPMGLILNPSGNTDTSAAIAMAITRVLDETNGNWGGYGRGWRKLHPDSAKRQTLGSSGDQLHFRIESMVSTSQGAVFTIEPEEQVAPPPATDVVFIDKIFINRFKYNPTTHKFDSTTTILPFSNDQSDSATAVNNTAIAFAPNGLLGYAVITGYNKNFSRPFGMIPYYSRTTDGGETWSDLKPIDYNKSIYETGYSSPKRDAFRDSLFVGNYVRFTDTTIVRADSSTQVGAHPVDYTMMDFDLAVDKDGRGMIFGTLCVGGFGDTLALTGPNFFRPQNGSWNVLITIPFNSDSASAVVVSSNQSVQGCWGDCDVDDESFNELNRPQVSMSADGLFMALTWTDTDQEAHPQLTDDNNSNPDFWMRAVRLDTDGSLFLAPQNRNLSKGSDKDGQFFLPSVAPTLLPKPGGYEVATTMVSLSDYVNPPGVELWPIQHLYVTGITVPTAIDSFPSQPTVLVNITSVEKPVSGSFGNNDLHLTFYPNPATNRGSIHLDGLRPGPAEIRLMNLQGQTLETRSLEAFTGGMNVPVSLKGIHKGVYLIRITNAGKSKTERLVIE